jgi:hypothetical protein
MICDAGEEVGKPGSRIGSVESAGGDLRMHCGSPLSTKIGD